MGYPTPGREDRRGWLDLIERIGNRLPEPPLLFALLALLVAVVSTVGAAMEWSVQPVRPQVAVAAGGAGEEGLPAAPDTQAGGHPRIEIVPVGAPIEPRSLMNADGVYWILSSMLRNFTGLPALGLIFVAMLGIGLAEKLGFFSALMRALAGITPRGALTPVIVFLGANASVASDAGYIVLPPLAAALFAAAGRPPVAGLAAAFAGVAGGFGAGFFPTGGDGALAGFAQDAAHVIDEAYSVNVLHNLYFKGASAVLVMLAGWWVTDRVVEPRLVGLSATASAGEVTGAGAAGEGEGGGVGMRLEARERRALGAALWTMGGVVAGFAVLILVPGMPLHGVGQPTLADGRVVLHHAIVTGTAAESVVPGDVLAREPMMIAEAVARARLVEPPGSRWSHVIVPVIFLTFLVPGTVFGWLSGRLRRQQDFVDALYSGIRATVPVLVIAFFMGQFVNWFAYTRLDRMLAYAGGSLLVRAELPTELLLVLFILLVVLGDFALSGMLSKFGVFAPIFIPMFMMVGISPELTTAAYRIGDSVVNIVTPLNSYLLVILAVLQKYRAGAGLGSLISLMLPYSIVFGVVWTGFLLAWSLAGLPLGPGAPLDYLPPASAP